MGYGSPDAINIATTSVLFELIGALERSGALTPMQVDGVLAAARDSQSGETRDQAQAFLDHLRGALAMARGGQAA